MRIYIQLRGEIMSQEELEEPWGQLISASNVAGTEEERVPVLGHKFWIGRDKGRSVISPVYTDTLNRFGNHFILHV